MYQCDNDETSAIVENRNDEYFVVTEQPESPPPSAQDEWVRRAARPVSRTASRQPYKTLFAGMLAVGIAFCIVIIPLGFWLSARYPTISDQVMGIVLVVVIFGVATGVMRLSVFLCGERNDARKAALAKGSLQFRLTG